MKGSNNNIDNHIIQKQTNERTNEPMKIGEKMFKVETWICVVIIPALVVVSISVVILLVCRCSYSGTDPMPIATHLSPTIAADFNWSVCVYLFRQ